MNNKVELLQDAKAVQNWAPLDNVCDYLFIICLIQWLQVNKNKACPILIQPNLTFLYISFSDIKLNSLSYLDILNVYTPSP